ncbi:MAG: 23S rRNA (adenine(2503)-C(2))-methyltransferase RlmN [Gemmatimonadetes bacterium]|nr:23S rRNA (adenine(2503)-C(2))-methyltransferase RlmN [Gemmatimonadota bacterium]NNL30687.1 23S rRNA (adenine(2503)-C(2))-methyltransferase RlmN [Gemmatimonadota bacterium]
MSSVDRIDLLSLTPEELRAALRAHFAARRQPGYRAEQVERWIFQEMARTFDEMTVLPVAERNALGEAFRIDEPEPATIQVSEDGTVKHLWRLADGELVESVLIPTERRLTLCISSQAGCAMGCTFCATGWGGFDRQLTAGEIVGQYRGSRRWAEENAYGPITNIVYMGMGEPLANRKAVHPSLTILNQGYDVGARRITVSTVGVVPGILELAGRPEQFRLALSLHAPDTDLRREIIPLEKRHPLPELIEALEHFDDAGGKRITFEYTMIDGINDDLTLIQPLAELADRVDAFVNLIPFNPIPYQPDWGPSPKQRIRAFESGLSDRGVAVAVRETRGRDIDAACGQLRGHTLVQIERHSRTATSGDAAPDPIPADLA